EMYSNYPIVRLTDATGNVFYARTFNWSSTGVATGRLKETVAFSLPAGIPAGDYSLEVIGCGIASNPVTFTVTGADVRAAQGRGVSSLAVTGVLPATGVAAVVPAAGGDIVRAGDRGPAPAATVASSAADQGSATLSLSGSTDVGAPISLVTD